MISIYCLFILIYGKDCVTMEYNRTKKKTKRNVSTTGYIAMGTLALLLLLLVIGLIAGTWDDLSCKISHIEQECDNMGNLSVNVRLINDNLGGPTSVFFGRLPGDDPKHGQRMFIAQQHGVVQYTSQGYPSGGP